MAPAEPSAALLSEAADWALALREGGAAEHEAFERWRARSPAHAAAWARAEAVFEVFGRVPDGAGRQALHALGRAGRRRTLAALAGLAVGAPAAWLAWQQAPWHEWRADLATATGERRDTVLPDGTRLVLNTASAVDVLFGTGERRLRLWAGEILVTTGKEASARPFVVDTPAGRVRALGTRFSVRLDGDRCRVAVYEHAVELQPAAGAPRRLDAGEQAEFDAGGVFGVGAADENDTLWQRGLLLARGRRLDEVAAELARHRRGLLRCDPAVAALRVSGALSLADTDAALALLARTLPLRVERRTRWWVTLAPA
ncbi:FecR domain-containing protein [Rubrivivax sp. JA1026]|uniref:FecR domain-containing protein n=1 Tax=Rubrivivax sp. JA1026 TaxID=2710888 RepID=UPI0013E92CF7|nr:FecR domain-containing protein [Rubrivivax sp. JA1026]